MATVCLKLATLPPAGAKTRYTLAFSGIDLPEIDITHLSGRHVKYKVPAGHPHAYRVKVYPTGNGQPMEYHGTQVFSVTKPQTKLPICQLVQDAIATTAD